MPYKDPEERRLYHQKYNKIHSKERVLAASEWKRGHPESVRRGAKIYREKNRESIRNKNRIYNAERRKDQEFRSINNIKTKEWRINQRKLVLEHYGGTPPSCSCCGESIIEFLTVDHIDNDGAAHRRDNKIASGGQTYSWIIKNNFPPGFQILCMNCNFGRAHSEGKVCPHKKHEVVTTEENNN